jgi:hypothetical protein
MVTIKNVVLTWEIAALCAETQDRQSEILEVLRKVLDISRFPSISILDDLVNVWGGAKSE